MSTILVVDDEPFLRALLSYTLSQEGYTVLLAADGRAAIETFQKRSESIDLVLLDIRMRGMDGPQTLRALQQVDPAVACCFLSEKLRDHEVAELMALGALGVFPKTSGTVTELVRSLAAASAWGG